MLRMITALEESKDDRFVSRATIEGESRTTYHLTSLRYLGSVVREKERFLLASAHFIRSSPPDGEVPPARGHSYLVVFRPDFTIAASTYEWVGDCHMEGNVLKRGKEVVVDFDDRDIITRHSGYNIGPGLPYFFADKITEEQWEDDDFLKKEAERK